MFGKEPPGGESPVAQTLPLVVSARSGSTCTPSFCPSAHSGWAMWGLAFQHPPTLNTTPSGHDHRQPHRDILPCSPSLGKGLRRQQDSLQHAQSRDAISLTASIALPRTSDELAPPAFTISCTPFAILRKQTLKHRASSSQPQPRHNLGKPKTLEVSFSISVPSSSRRLCPPI